MVMRMSSPAVTARGSVAFAAAEADVHAAGVLVVNVDRHTIALVSDCGAVRAESSRSLRTVCQSHVTQVGDW